MGQYNTYSSTCTLHINMNFHESSSVATMSLKNACAKYGVTEEDCVKANIPCQWKSMYGNSYALVYIEDIIDLKRELQSEKNQAEEKHLKLTLGEQGYENHKKEQDEKAKEMKQKPTIKLILQKMLDVGANDPSVDIKGCQIATNVAKKTWGIQDYVLSKLENDKQGRCKVYTIEDVIKASLNMTPSKKGPSDRHKAIMERLENNNDENAKNQYAAYYRRQLDDFIPKVVQEVAKELSVNAEKQLKNQMARARALRDITGTSNAVDEEDSDDKATDGKKRKTCDTVDEDCDETATSGNKRKTRPSKAAVASSRKQVSRKRGRSSAASKRS
jgi:hypothetical protein